MHQPVSAKQWRDRSNSLGYIQGGTEAQVDLLRQVLLQLPCDGTDALEWLTPEGKRVSVRCEDLCRRVLSPASLAERSDGGQWQPSTYSQQWLENKDNSFLAAHLHAHVKYFGELLLAIGDQTKHADLLEVATETYGLNWTSLSPVRDRTGWLRSLGMIELWGQRVVRTELGDALLEILPLCPPESARGEEEAAGPDGGEEGQPALFGDSLELEQVDLRNRRALIGYIPRGNASNSRDGDSTLTATAALRRLVTLLGDGTGLEEFGEQCGSEFGISKSSFTSTMHALRHMGLVEQTSFNHFAPSEDARRLVDKGNERLLAVYLHSRYQFFGEILRHLGKPATTSALVAVAKEMYGCTQASNGEVRLRLGFLQDAGLAERVDWQRFRVTAAGRSFAKHLTLQLPVETEPQETDPAGPQRATPSPVPEAVIAQLRQHGTVGTDSRDFEEAVARAFAFLGFHAEHFGGSGRTDVLGIAQLATKDRYRIIVDAKSSGSGQVAESSVKFDALRDHKRKHKADHVVVVGPEFAPRLKNWAAENEVVLLRIEDLVSLLDRHSRNPMPLTELRDALSRIDTFSDDLAERYQALERRSLLMRRIIDLAFQEAVDEDPIDDGYISVENIIYALRKEFTPRPSRQEVDELIAFLSSPVVAALETAKGRHKLIDSPRNLALRLAGLGSTIATG
ncbi:restriction endonuclease [Nonomuraea basaltis]|uniref:restriction endonuclease n=1 Tax=Nonomuraea basaltis TaxID=2495887 RepID=UPI00110C5CE9|nr:restriction endonuclease [Nonomuraea basaltis]TMR88216.1 restriction endonuclease [Nonomuraea basaltis]